MKKILILILITLSVTACKKSEKINKSKLQKIVPVAKPTLKHKPKKVGDYMTDKEEFTWSPRGGEADSYYPRITFLKEYMKYQMHGQCYYWFFTYHIYTGADKIELIWTYKRDCLWELKSLHKSNGIKNYPHEGDVLCAYSLINDTVMKVKYYFPEWARKVNEIERDSVFPNYIYLNKEVELE